MNYITVDADGYIVGGGHCTESDFDSITPAAGLTIIAGVEHRLSHSRRHKYINDQVVDAGPLFELTYADYRRAEYPPPADYLDAIVKGDQAALDAYVAKCLAVKAKYPKPS